MSFTLHIIICSTRPGRVGPTVAEWVLDVAREHGGFDPVLIDLADFALPIFDEPKHPRLHDYVHEHTKRWSASVAAADAFVFVTPEYNFSPPPSLLNALDYLFVEWAYKPAAFVSYGGVSGGLRAVQAEKLTMTTLKMVPIVEAVSLHAVVQQIQDGKLVPAAAQVKAARAMLDETLRWTTALARLRQPQP